MDARFHCKGKATETWERQAQSLKKQSYREFEGEAQVPGECSDQEMQVQSENSWEQSDWVVLQGKTGAAQRDMEAKLFNKIQTTHFVDKNFEYPQTTVNVMSLNHSRHVLH